ncbi:Protein of unknown function (DUF3712) domain containing protein [Naviculisporaceae sp. PSN 640]
MSDIETKPAPVATEAVSEKPRKRGFAGHCARFWWVYLIAVIIITVIVVPVVLLVAVPKIAQDKLDEAELTIESIVMTNSEPNKFTMSVNSVIKSDGKVHATIEPFTGQMYVEGDDRAFAAVDFPETTSDAFQTVNVTQETNIEDLEAFTDFNKKLLQSTDFQIKVSGDTGIHVKGIDRRYPVTFRKTITLAGLQTFEGTEVFDSELSVKGYPDGTNFKGQTRIPNRSVVTFEVGNATFDTYLLGKKVGLTYLDDLILKPGNDNVFPMRASIENLAILDIMGKKPYCETGIVPFVLVGKKVVNKGKDLPYFANALAAGQQTVPIDLRTPLKAAGLEIPCKSD